MLQSENEFLLTLENQRKPSAKLLETLLETPSSVDDMVHWTWFPRFARTKIFVFNNENSKIH